MELRSRSVAKHAGEARSTSLAAVIVEGSTGPDKVYKGDTWDEAMDATAIGGGIWRAAKQKETRIDGNSKKCWCNGADGKMRLLV